SLAAHLALLEARAMDAEAAGVTFRLPALPRGLGLDPGDMEVFMVVLAPDLDPRFERLYGYLLDDVSRRRASVGLALELTGSRRAVDTTALAETAPRAR